MSVTRCCVLCGRWGTRQFREYDGDGGHACSNDRACRLRAVARGYPWPYGTGGLA